MQGNTPFMMAAPGAAAPCGLPAILFDFDGTLIDSMALCVRELQETFKDLGLPVPPRALLEKCNGPTHEESAELLGLPLKIREKFVKIRGGYQMALLETCQRIFPGVKEMLSVLSGCAQLFIVSNSSQEYIDKSVVHWHIGGYFVKALGCKPGQTKTQAVDGLIKEYRPLRAVMAGDRASDIRAGRENGLWTIAAAYGYGSKEEHADADCIAASVQELTDLCLQFLGR